MYRRKTETTEYKIWFTERDLVQNKHRQTQEQILWNAQNSSEHKQAKFDISDKGHKDSGTRYIIHTSLYANQATTGLKEVVLFAASLAKHK